MSPRSNEDFSMFNSLNVQVKDLARKSYRAIPLNLWIYLEGDSLPHELCNISISGLCFKLNSQEEQEGLCVGKRIQIHIFSEVHDDILTLEAEVVRTNEDTCSCFFPLLADKEETFLDKLILEMQKQVITQRKLGHKKELEREKLQIQELRRLQQLNKLRLEEIHSRSQGIAINPLINGQQTDIAELAQNINVDYQLDDKGAIQTSVPNKKISDFTLFEDINIVTDAQNRKTYRTNPTNLWVYVHGILKPHKIMNLSTSGVCFKYKSSQQLLEPSDKINIEIFYNIQEKILATPARVVRIDEETCSCVLPSLGGESMVLLSKLVAEMKKYEISADTLEELRALVHAYETQEIEDKKQQLNALAQEESRIRQKKARLLAIVEEEARLRQEKIINKQKQVQEYLLQTKGEVAPNTIKHVGQTQVSQSAQSVQSAQEESQGAMLLQEQALQASKHNILDVAQDKARKNTAVIDHAQQKQIRIKVNPVVNGTQRSTTQNAQEVHARQEGALVQVKQVAPLPFSHASNAQNSVLQDIVDDDIRKNPDAVTNALQEALLKADNAILGAETPVAVLETVTEAKANFNEEPMSETSMMEDLTQDAIKSVAPTLVTTQDTQKIAQMHTPKQAVPRQIIMDIEPDTIEEKDTIQINL